MYITEFEVESDSAFPLDMLRYDQCAPSCSEDVNEIGESLDRHARSERCKIGGVFRVRLNVRGATKQQAFPTINRWSSFGWKVVNIVPTRKA